MFSEYFANNVINCPTCNHANNHIQSIYLVNGDDDYNEIERMEVNIPEDGRFFIRIQNPRGKTNYRLRGEPAVEIKMACEMCEDFWYLKISHHKGNVHLDREVQKEK